MNTRTHAGHSASSRVFHAVLALLLPCLLLAVGCQRKPAAAPIEADVSLAVAGFTQPVSDLASLAGYVPDGGSEVKPKTLAELDAYVVQNLSTETKRSFRGPSQTRQCMPRMDEAMPTSRHGALDYYIGVGECMNADYLLVPQLLFWREREGGPAGVTQPASVIIDLYVLDIKEHGVAARYRFDETQVSLAQNVLTLPKFLQRGGKWVTAEELAAWGINDGLRVLGLK